MPPLQKKNLNGKFLGTIQQKLNANLYEEENFDFRLKHFYSSLIGKRKDKHQV